MNRNWKWLIGVGSLLLLLAVSTASAQTTIGTLRGFVSEEKGEALPGVTIEISGGALLSPRSAVTDGRGQYRFVTLPPGTYTLCAKLQGFEVCWMKGVAVQVGKTTTADIQMKMGTLENTIQVTAAKPVIDLERSQKNYNIEVELLETVPLAPRANYVDAFYALPGVAGASLGSPLVNAGSITHNLIPGATYFWSQHNQDDGYENKIMVDGMEINDSMSGTSYANFNYEAIQEIDVKTAGAGAEYGTARSSFMSIVTKSGGNTLQMSTFAQIQPRSFNWTNVEGGAANKVSYFIPNITLSGPILKDKLWFLASYKYNNEAYQYPNTIVVPELIRDTKGHMPYMKLTWQPTTKHTLSVVYQNDYSTIDNGGFPSTDYSTEATAQQNRQGGPMYSLTWRWLVSDSLYFNFVGGFAHKPRDNWSVTESPQYRYTERAQGGSTLLYDKGYGEDYYSTRENALFTGSLTYYAEDLFNTGAHELKAGIDIRPYNHVTRTRKYWMDGLGFYQYRLGLDYANYGLTEPYIYRGYNVKAAPGTPQDRYDNEVVVSAESVFLQDTWVISKNLALSLGLRWEHQRENMFYRDEIPAWMDAIYFDMRNNIEFDDSGLAPRLGLTYNWDKVGVFKFHFGRYYEFVGTGDYNNYSRTIAFGEYRMSTANIGQGPEAMTVYSDPPLAYRRGLQQRHADGVQRRVHPVVRARDPEERGLRHHLPLPQNQHLVHGGRQRRLHQRRALGPRLPRLRHHLAADLVRRRRHALEVRLQEPPVQHQAQLLGPLGHDGQLLPDVAAVLQAEVRPHRSEAVRLRQSQRPGHEELRHRLDLPRLGLLPAALGHPALHVRQRLRRDLPGRHDGRLRLGRLGADDHPE